MRTAHPVRRDGLNEDPMIIPPERVLVDRSDPLKSREAELWSRLVNVEVQLKATRSLLSMQATCIAVLAATVVFLGCWMKYCQLGGLGCGN